MATSTFDKVTENITHGLHEAGERVVDFKNDTSRGLGKSVDTLGKLMKKHPLVAIAIGLGLGYALARIIRRD
ncbi:MAG: hypothetical protein H0V17_18620 [Deltaproteobacteria bacterium]|nr:hypothetical protein [Deltaproteobacteria bacterium]